MWAFSGARAGVTLLFNQLMPLSASICAIKDLIRQSLRKFKAFKKKNLWENLSEGGVEYKIRVEPLLIFSFWHFWLFFSWIGTNPESVRILNRYDFFSVPIQDSYRFRIRTDSGSVPIQETPSVDPTLQVRAQNLWSDFWEESLQLCSAPPTFLYFTSLHSIRSVEWNRAMT